MSEARERWRELVAQWRSSEQTGREFAARRGVNPSTLAHWAWRLGQEPQDGSRAMARGPAMIEVCAHPAGDDRFERNPSTNDVLKSSVGLAGEARGQG
jgi:hypothetical protein